MSVGIVGYGAYVPPYRIKAETIAKVWGEDARRIVEGLGIREKSVPGKDEDTATISVEAARNALARALINPKEIGAIYVGSESHPYAVKPTAGIVGEAIGAGNNYTAADTEFACKAGTAAIQMCMGLVQSGMIKYGLAIGADTSQAAPGDALEYSAAAGGAAFLVGREEKELLAEITDPCSFTSDTPDFWRRGLAPHPRHAGRFTGEPAYFKHVFGATKALLAKTNTQPKDYDYVVFHTPNAKFPTAAAAKLGFTPQQYRDGLLVTTIGNTYSGCSPLGVSRVLDKARPGQTLLVVSYGSGSGSDAFRIVVKDLIEERRGLARRTEDYIARKTYLEYAQYAKHMEEIH